MAAQLIQEHVHLVYNLILHHAIVFAQLQFLMSVKMLNKNSTKTLVCAFVPPLVQPVRSKIQMIAHVLQHVH